MERALIACGRKFRFGLCLTKEQVNIIGARRTLTESIIPDDEGNDGGTEKGRWQ